MIDTKFGPQMTEDEQYDDGFRTGLTWDAPWTPGGPYISRSGFGFDPEWAEFCERSRLGNQAWRRGWQDGVNHRRTPQ